MRVFKVPAKLAGTRADVFIAQKLKFSRSSLQKMFDLGKVKHNGKILKSSYRLRGGESIQADTALLTSKPQKTDLPVLYEDESVIVIDKPAGVLTHSKGALNDEATVASFIAPKLTDRNLRGNRAGIVHRLDRLTSGVIIAAKTEAAQKWLQKQFSTRKVMKQYLAIVEGQLSQPEAIIDAPIARNPKRPNTFKVSSQGKPAQTKYEVIKSMTKDNQKFTWLRLWPYTGRTHQIRVHLSYIGHPIVGDAVYGRAAKHLMLHAEALELTLPDKTQMRFESKPPEYFSDFENDKE